MVNLTVRNAQGNVIVTGQFGSMLSMLSWIEAEKLRPEFDPSTTFEYVENTPAAIDHTKIAELKLAAPAKESARQAVISDLKSAKPVMSVVELSDAVNKILLYLGIK